MSWKKSILGEGAWRDLVASLSVVNLWWVRIWLKILPYNEGSNFFLACSPLNSYIAAILNVLFWGGMLFVLLRLCRRKERLFPWLVLGVMFLTSVLVAYGVGIAYVSVAKFVFLFGPGSARLLSIACWGISFCGLLLLVGCRKWLARYYAVLPLLFAPYLLVTFTESVQAIAKVEPSARFHPHGYSSPRPLANPLPLNVVWVIFDETDYRLCFGKRPSFLSLPAFDRLKEESFFATNAYSPNDNTQTSLPSLLSGIPLTKTIAAGARRLTLERTGTLAHSDFSSADTIFTEIKKRGGSTALMGWFLPYSRIMKNVDLCHDYSRYNVYASDSLSEVFFTQWREVVDMRFLPYRNTLLAENQIGIVGSMRRDVAETVRNNDPSLMFLHYSVPHSPNIYDRKTGRLAFNRDKHRGYFDNLALADRCLSELRKSLEEKGKWESSLVIVSSDHHWRTNTYDQLLDKQHVPFLVKFPGQVREVTYNGRFNTLLTKELILAIVDGKVRSPEEAGKWLERAMQQGKTPIVFQRQQPDAD